MWITEGKPMLKDIEKVFHSEEEIKEIVTEMGRRISEDYQGKNLLLVSVLKGSVVFMADLMRAITIPCEIDFMAVSSYGNGVKTSGVVKMEWTLPKTLPVKMC
jgi:hypoxanthine phosphoribosyltransferase